MEFTLDQKKVIVDISKASVTENRLERVDTALSVLVCIIFFAAITWLVLGLTGGL